MSYGSLGITLTSDHVPLGFERIFPFQPLHGFGRCRASWKPGVEVRALEIELWDSSLAPPLSLLLRGVLRV
jgi:hypothetical protein